MPEGGHVIMQTTRSSADEVVERGEAIYQQTLRARVENEENTGKHIVINIGTGEYEIGDEYLPITRRMLRVDPDAELCILRVGYPAAARLGGRMRPVTR
jgi:hypothetical protein